MTPLENVAIASPAFKRDPHGFYAMLRAERPVCRVMLPDRRPAWLVARYDDVAALLKDPRFAKDRANALTPVQLQRLPWVPPMFAPLLRNMLDRDDPDHARLRSLVTVAFTPRRVAMMAATTNALCTALLDDLTRRDRFDLIGDFALPLPVAVISDLLGVPMGDRARFARWSHTMIRNTMTPLAMLRALPDMIAFVRYLRWLVAARRTQPADDLVSALVAAEADGDRLDADELLGMIAILLSAGHETTTNLIGNGMLALLGAPDELARLRQGTVDIETAIEELLRFAGPVDMSTFRYARTDLEIAGTRIARGDLVLGLVTSANRDENHFADGGRLDLGRNPNRHLSFGMGGHYCVGAALARMEGRIAIAALAERFPNLRLAVPVAALRWNPGLVLRGLSALPVTAQR